MLLSKLPRWLRGLFGMEPSRQIRRHSHGRRSAPQVELLEERTLLSGFPNNQIVPDLPAPTGTVVIGGLIVSTVLTLLIVPAAFSLADGLEKRLGPWLRRNLLTYRDGDDNDGEHSVQPSATNPRPNIDLGGLQPAE